MKKIAEDRFYSHDELLKQYVEEKYQLVHYELILDSLYMAKIKDNDWLEKKNIAERLYNESKELLDFLDHLLFPPSKNNSEEKAIKIATA